MLVITCSRPRTPENHVEPGFMGCNHTTSKNGQSGQGTYEFVTNATTLTTFDAVHPQLQQPWFWHAQIQNKLLAALVLCLIFMALELVGGYFAHRCVGGGGEGMGHYRRHVFGGWEVGEGVDVCGV
eukprot:262237-Pelagomonas_calceolata.AAC.2